VRHHELYLDLAKTYFPAAEVARRLDELLAVEAGIVAELPPRAAMY
jgi:tRNA isopentenyl-2-thiomethyl-A-37 hydroxylase MiaE